MSGRSGINNFRCHPGCEYEAFRPGRLCLAYQHAKDTFTLPGLGKLVLVNRKARTGRNPATGETIQIKAKRVVKFRVAEAAKDAILGAK